MCFLLFFVCQSIVTIGITIYYLVVNFSRDAWKHYNYWAVMSLDMFAILFWLISLAIMAADIAPYADETEVCDYYYGTCTWLGAIFFACLAAIAGLGGAEWYVFFWPAASSFYSLSFSFPPPIERMSL